MTHEYQNSFTTGEYGHVLESCIGAIGLFAVVGALLVAAVVGGIKWANTPPTPK
jgi:hypothetical protein